MLQRWWVGPAAPCNLPCPWAGPSDDQKPCSVRFLPPLSQSCCANGGGDGGKSDGGRSGGVVRGGCSGVLQEGDSDRPVSWVRVLTVSCWRQGAGEVKLDVDGWRRRPPGDGTVGMDG